MRVGIYAPNSYHWLVHDLALIAIGAISVPFTDDFAGAVNDDLLTRYDIALLLIAKSSARLFPQRPTHVALIDADNENVRVADRNPPHHGDEDDHHSSGFFVRLCRWPERPGDQPQGRGENPAPDHGCRRRQAQTIA
jgi:acyl-coenzyme A synthetase/AMP-(fatty) acid ligase